MDCPAQFISLIIPQFLNEGMMPRTIHTGNIIQINDESIQLFSQVEIQESKSRVQNVTSPLLLLIIIQWIKL